MKVVTEQRGRVTVVVSNAHEGALLESGWDIEAIRLSSEVGTSEKRGLFTTEDEALEAAFRRATELGLM